MSLLLQSLVVSLAAIQPTRDTSGAVVLRVATFNVQDLRTEDIRNPQHQRARKIAETIQRIRPNVILLNELAYDSPDSPGASPTDPPGQNAQRFADTFLKVPQGPGLVAMRFAAFTAPTNTGIPSGFDLDRSGSIVNSYPAPLSAPSTMPPVEPSEQGRAYGGDCWGFGTFPGQYGMALLVDERLTILKDRVRTFRLLPWEYMDGAMIPPGPDNEPSWYPPDVAKVMRLSSKSHWDVPVRLPAGQVLHFLCSHPTPPVFDGPEDRNGRRNHDEIRFWADYIDNARFIVDDSSKPGGLPEGSFFIVLGDLNADPDKGDSFKNPMTTFLLKNPLINTTVTPSSDIPIPGLLPTDTAEFKLRVDYVLPSRLLGIDTAGIYRGTDAANSGWTAVGSDHFPVWVDVIVPPLPKP